MAQLLVVHHSPTPALRALTDAVLAGTASEGLEGVEARAVGALEATAADVLAADALVLGTSANFGYMSGALKHFLDTVFLDVGGALSPDGSAGERGPGATPYGLWVHGRHDVSGAVSSVQRIVGALPWRQSAPVLEVVGEVDDAALGAARELGATLAALVST